MSDTSEPRDATAVEIGTRIRRCRKAAGYESMEAFAHALGVSWPTVSSYERGVRKPTLERLYAIADLLEVEIAELLPEQEVAA